MGDHSPKSLDHAGFLDVHRIERCIAETLGQENDVRPVVRDQALVKLDDGDISGSLFEGGLGLPLRLLQARDPLLKLGDVDHPARIEVKQAINLPGDVE